jgi:hypothetical protein
MDKSISFWCSSFILSNLIRNYQQKKHQIRRPCHVWKGDCIQSLSLKWEYSVLDVGYDNIKLDLGETVCDSRLRTGYNGYFFKTVMQAWTNFLQI